MTLIDTTRLTGHDRFIANCCFAYFIHYRPENFPLETFMNGPHYGRPKFKRCVMITNIVCNHYFFYHQHRDTMKYHYEKTDSQDERNK